MAASSNLTLSSATFAKLSPHPYLLANLQPPDPSTPSARTNGRQPRQPRPTHINSSSLSHAHGSAIVRNGDTTVICGVRAESLLASHIPNYRAPSPTSTAPHDHVDELGEYDLLVPNIELATGCAPNFLPGVPPTSLAQTLSTRVYSLLHSSGLLDAEDLRIYQDEELAAEPGDVEDAETEASSRTIKAYWVLYIDVLFVSFDGNPFDAAWTGILAALKDTKLPVARWDADRDLVLCSPTESRPLQLRGLPVACTAAVFAGKGKLKKGNAQFWILVDPDRFEEELCDENVTMIVDRSEGGTKVLGISKSGGTVVGPAVMGKFTEVAEARWQELRDALSTSSPR